MDLQNLRKQIDRIDLQILELLNKRSTIGQKIGKIKRELAQPIYDPQREEELLRELEQKNKGPITSGAIRSIYREVFSSSRSLQKSLKVAYMGPEGTYSHQAALMRFGSNDEMKPYRTIAEVFEAVSRGEVDTGIVPIENSTEGGVNATYDCLISTDVLICGESYMRINHVLAASTSKPNIKRIYSHPQPLGQCRQWLANRYPDATLLEVSSTSVGGKKAKEDPESAAIVNPHAASLHHLHTIATNISDMPNNTTRFLVLNRIPAKPSKRDKTSLLFAVAHQAGALSHVLTIFAKNKLNLQKIESRPAPHKSWEYLFFVDVSGHHTELHLKKALQQIVPKTLWIKILGSYPEEQPYA
jgi:chorismate mutase/prephenate dehydratase